MARQREQIKQAVILAGGRGERLRPLTDNIPKPMVPIGDKPFLWFLCDQLLQQGFEEVLILAGYRSDAIEVWARSAPFGSTDKVRVLVTPPEFDPLARLRDSQPSLAARFLLLYGDNFLSLRFEKIRMAHAEADSTVTVLIGKKSPGNIMFTPGDSARYLIKRSTAAAHVELGYMAIEKQAFFEGVASTLTLQEALALTGDQGELAVLEYLDRYYSISDPPRYEEMKRFLEPKQIILLDRDGTLNAKPPRGTYVTSEQAFSLLPTAVDALQRLSMAGFSFIVITNQAGVATGDITQQQLDSIHQKMKQEFDKLHAPLLGVYCCTAHWKEINHPERKPQAGLFYKVSHDFALRLDTCWYIGDDSRDVLAAWNANCLCAFIGSAKDLTNLSPTQLPALYASDLAQAATKLLVGAI